MENILFLYNTKSGKGKIEKNIDRILEVFSALGYSIRAQLIEFGKNPFDGNNDIDTVIVAGGDGTVNYVINNMKSRGLDLDIGIIPAGTANDFAGAVGMSKNPIEAARQIATGEIEHLDCGKVNDMYFINIFSFGLFTTTSQRTPDGIKHRIGKLAYIIEGVKEFRSMHSIPMQVTADGETFDINSLMVLVFNGETAGGFHLARRASVKDGKFDCLMLERHNFFVSTLAMGRYLAGGSPKIVKHIKAKNIRIVSAVHEPTDIDGQKGADFPLNIECIAGGLRVICPQ